MQELSTSISWKFGPLVMQNHIQFLKSTTRMVHLGACGVKGAAFDAIHEWHRHCGHLGQEKIWKFCRSNTPMSPRTMLSSIAQLALRAWRKTKWQWLGRAAKRKSSQRTYETEFRLILLTFKNWGSGISLVWCPYALGDDPEEPCHRIKPYNTCALPRKCSNLVAYKLREIFGLIGYSKIFHTDKGKYFTAKLILKLLCELNPNIVAVTGQPRHPQDQLSAENVNALVKRVLGSVFTKRH